MVALPSSAEFMISSAIIEFNAGGPHQQDIDLISRGTANDYIVSEIQEIKNPGLNDESRYMVDDPTSSMLLVTPDRTILGAGSRKTLRFVLLKEPDIAEHIFRVAIKPVIKGIQNDGKVGLKVLIGYEVLVIVRPTLARPSYKAARSGRRLQISNTGNTNILFQNAQQCPPEPARCKAAPVARVYPGEATTVTLPLDAPATYSVWDGKEAKEARF